MPVYAIGDIQGCLDELQRLLAAIDFDPGADRLLLVGDLVNRGPRSLDTLRFVRDLGPSAVSVLGNHDLHLLAVAYGHGKARPKDTLKPLLAAADSEEMLTWLRHRPLLHREPDLGYTMVHAGLPPQWSVDQAAACAAEVETVLRGPRFHTLLEHMYGDQPNQWHPELRGWDRLRFTINCLTRIRYCDSGGRLVLNAKGPPGHQPAGTLPWFQVSGRASQGQPVIFGHWSTLGAYAGDGVFGLDSGCVWGGVLTALRLDDQAWFQVDCSGYCVPESG